MTIDSLDMATVVAATLISILIAIGIYIVFRNNRKMANMKYQELLQQEKVMQVDELKDDILKLTTEIKAKLENNEEIRQYEDEFESFEVGYMSGYFAIDTLLSYKIKRCNELGIKTEIDVNGFKKSGISEMRMISLVGNLVDNAIESSYSQQAPFISIKSKVINDMWIFKIVNSKNSSYFPIAASMKTVKKDKNNHGIGMKIIKKIVNDSNGEIRLTDRGDTFEVLISIKSE